MKETALLIVLTRCFSGFFTKASKFHLNLIVTDYFADNFEARDIWAHITVLFSHYKQFHDFMLF